jgi:precorrin-6A/cobalt-precorrin-6A reductase
MSNQVLILGGTTEARTLAQELDDAGVTVISSLAGRVAQPRLPAGAVRVGGFGGPDALARWLAEHGIVAVVDATHPFAQRISASATAAAAVAGVPLLRIERPRWQPRDGDRWRWVEDLPQAARALREGNAGRVFLTTGRQGLSAFATNDENWFLIRCIDPPDVVLPANHEVLLSRGPYTLAGELALIDDHGIEIVVTKDSGGSLTEAKLDAARVRELPVLIVRRPPRPEVPTVGSVTAAVAWAVSQSSG